MKRKKYYEKFLIIQLFFFDNYHHSISLEETCNMKFLQMPRVLGLLGFHSYNCKFHIKLVIRIFKLLVPKTLNICAV